MGSIRNDGPFESSFSFFSVFSGSLASNEVFSLMASTSFSGEVLLGSYFAQAEPLAKSALASATPSTFRSVRRTAAAQPAHVMPRTSSSTFWCSAARTTRFAEAYLRGLESSEAAPLHPAWP